jgi:hypothetical protein
MPTYCGARCAANSWTALAVLIPNCVGFVFPALAKRK